MHNGPGPFFGAIIFLVFPTNQYKNMVFGAPGHARCDRASQAVILHVEKKIFLCVDISTKIHIKKNIHRSSYCKNVVLILFHKILCVLCFNF